MLQEFEYFRLAITGREYSKFIFTKTLSDIVEMLAELGELYGLAERKCPTCHSEIPSLERKFSPRTRGDMARYSAAQSG